MTSISYLNVEQEQEIFSFTEELEKYHLTLVS